MGLDQYAYCRAKKEGTWDDSREISYWRKHPNLQGWMEQLWMEKGMPGTGNKSANFNCIELELTTEDLDRLERDINNKLLPRTQGFFFGDDSDEYYRARDLDFIRKAKAELFCGLKVFYNSSW